jgi:hypothetical protein
MRAQGAAPGAGDSGTAASTGYAGPDDRGARIIPLRPRYPSARCAPPDNVVQFPRSRTIAGLFWMQPKSRQLQRLRELGRAGLSPDAIALLTQQSVGAVCTAIGEGHE